MTDITFVTSNKTKLAHARYLCRDHPVNILYYKKLYYGIGYEEPRIDNRGQLLTESFKDAATRWKKNVSKSDNRLFFIEDTSVRIDALSEENREVPGVDVKYWMQNRSFDMLDQELRARGNNRKCSVSSHIMLFLTKDLRTKLGVNEEFKVFTSTAYGSITEKEYCFETQILYPWLDNRTFNKWFIPDGCSLPVSMLDISEADKGDFRKGALMQMISFLEDNGVIENRNDAEIQLRLPFYDSFIVCGRTCAGKTTIGKYLVERLGYYHIEASEFMTHRLLETHGTDTAVDKHKFAKEVLAVEPLFVVDRLIDYLREHHLPERVVITGFRTQDEVRSFLNAFDVGKMQVVFIHADFKERFRRWRVRQRDVDNYSEERFRDIDQIQEEMGIGAIETMPGIEIVDNNNNGLDQYYQSFCEKCLPRTKLDGISINISDLGQMKVSLERAVLITLAIEYKKDEARSFTTTEISHLVNLYFKDFKRSKNNISRYFNQAFYVYYEVSRVDGKNRYRISPIGYSEAVLTLRKLNTLNSLD